MNCPLCGTVNNNELDLCNQCGRPIRFGASGFLDNELLSKISQIAQHNFRQGNFHQAIKDINEYIQIEDSDPAAYIFRGKLYDYLAHGPDLSNREVRNILTQGIEDFSHAIFLDPDNSIAYFNRGNAFLARTDFDFALDDFSKVISLSSDDELIKVMAYSLSAFAYEKLGDLDQAMIDHENALEIDSTNEFAILLRDDYLRRTKQSQITLKNLIASGVILIFVMIFFYFMIRS